MPKSTDIIEFSAPAKSIQLWGETVTPLVDDWSVRVEADPEGGAPSLTTRFVDPAHVAMGVSRLRPSVTLEDASRATFGLDFSKLVDRVKPLESKECVDVRIEPGDTIRLRQGRFTRSLSLLDPTGYADPKVPTLKPSTRASLDLDDLKKALKMANQVSDQVHLVARGKEAVLVAEGDTDRDESIVGVLYPASTPAMALYSIDYLTRMVSALEKLGDVAEAGWESDNPLTLTSGWTPMNVNVLYMLAPRIESEGA